MSQSRADAAWLTLASDPTRARLLSLILASPNGRATVSALTEALELRQPTVTHHARALLDHGVLVREAEGRRAWYSVAADYLERVDALFGPAAAVGAPAPEVVDDTTLVRISRDLAPRFAGTFGLETVERCVRESHELLRRRAGAATGRLASTTAAFAAERLAALADAEPGAEPARPPELLFVCVQNAGRSQLASAIVRHLAGDRVRVRTAGSAPAAVIRPAVVAALDEIGVPIGAEFPKPLTDEVVRAADVVVTMGCGDACPVYPGKRYEDWELDDPAGRPLHDVRRIRNDIEQRVRDLLSDLIDLPALAYT